MYTKTQEYLVWIGFAGAVIYFLALLIPMGFIPPMSPLLPAEEISQIYAENNMRFRIGAIVMMAVAGFWLPIAAVISMQLARLEKGFPLWSVLQAMSSTLGALFFALPVLVWYVAAFTVTRDSQITATMNEFAWLAFLTPIAAFTFQLLPMIVICFTVDQDEKFSAFPRWLGYMSIWMIITGELPILAVLFKSGPFAWNGIISFWLPVFAYSAWIIAVVYLLIRAIRFQSKNNLSKIP